MSSRKVIARKAQRNAAPQAQAATPFQAGWNEDNIPDLPHMTPQGLALLELELERSRIYLEYGSGGSSILAVRKGVRKIYSVDSDAGFLKAVHAKIKTMGARRGSYVPLFADIGPTKAWGRPADESKATLWPQYISAPWDAMRKKGHQPDLVLIDGRFRVASFLMTAMLASPGCVILFDDYFDRPYYHVIERHFQPVEKAGRLAKFVINTFDRPDLALIDLMAYCTTYD